jgi:hypothetical protein
MRWPGHVKRVKKMLNKNSQPVIWKERHHVLDTGADRIIFKISSRRLVSG